MRKLTQRELVQEAFRDKLVQIAKNVGEMAFPNTVRNYRDIKNKILRNMPSPSTDPWDTLVRHIIQNMSEYASQRPGSKKNPPIVFTQLENKPISTDEAKQQLGNHTIRRYNIKFKGSYNNNTMSPPEQADQILNAVVVNDTITKQTKGKTKEEPVLRVISITNTRDGSVLEPFPNVTKPNTLKKTKTTPNTTQAQLTTPLNSSSSSSGNTINLSNNP